jgi:aryl-alcohol dehydrogenase-like predicted oxidoreductase
VEYRQLGRTGVQVGKLALGCMNFGGRTDEAETTRIVDQALDAGVNLIDTANVYGHDPSDFSVGRGRSEEILGRVLARDRKRDRVVLATKAHFPMTDDANDRGNSRRHIIASCEASLRRLRTDYIDLFQLHHPSSDVPIDETLRALDDLVRRGLIRYVGTSSFGAWQIVEALWVAHEYRLNRFATEQPAYHLLDRRAERELLPMAQTFGIAVLPWSPTAGGFLTGKYPRGEAPGGDTRYGAFWTGANSVFADAAYDVLDAVRDIAANRGCTPGQVAVSWCSSQPGVTAPIVGPRTTDQLTEYLGAADVTLDAIDRARLDEAAPPGRATVPFYGADGFAWTTWGPHRHRWP